MGIETTGMSLEEQERKRVTLSGQAGHQAAWDRGAASESLSEDPAKLEAVMREKDVLRQISEQSFDDIDTIMDRIAEALLKNPELASDPHFKARSDAARDRLNDLIKKSLH